MLPETKHFYDFGDFRLDLAEKILLRDGKFIPVTPKVFETLCVLVENAGRTVEKDELMQKIWQERFVEESNLTFNIGMLRKALGDDAAKPRYVETVPRRGYRFIAEVKRVIDDEFQTSGDYEIHSLNGHSTNGHTVKSNSENGINDDSASEKFIVETPPAKISSASRRQIVFYSLLAAVLISAGAAAFFLTRVRQPSYYERFGRANLLSVEKLSDTGNLEGTNISPDGKFIVYNLSENGKNTLWRRQLATGKSIPLFAATDETIHGIGFSNDGEHVFFTHQRPNEPLVLSRISTLGGTPTRILSGLHSGFTFSPDERQVAFGRYDDEGTRMMIADADGQNERQVFLSPKPRYMYGINWSPDGKSIAYCIGSSHYEKSGTGYGVYQFNLADGTEKSLTDFKWNFVENTHWLPDGSGMLITARENLEGAKQIWRLSIPDGQVAPVTDDSNSLGINGTSNDFSLILATQTTLKSKLWIASKDNSSDARPISDAQFDVDWTPDGKIIFQTRNPIKSDIWVAANNGDGKRQLTVNDSLERSPQASLDGRFIVYVSTQNGRQNVWRMGADGANQIALTSGDGEHFPTITPDGAWVVFNSIQMGSLWKVPIEGGAATQLCTAGKYQRVSISPDGKKLAYLGRGKDNKRKLLVVSFPECSPLQEFDAAIIVASPPKIVWTKDGKNLIYDKDDTTFAGNLWQQSLDGGEPQKLTNFTSERIFDFAFSPDGSQIAFVRGTWNFDAVLLKGFK